VAVGWVGVSECVLFIGTQFSILYTSMYSPAEAATLGVLGWPRAGVDGLC
jgi:hypothetical protein